MMLALCAALLGTTLPASRLAQGAPAPPADADWVLRTLAQPAPMRTPFLEVRDSPLLKEALRLQGEYRRPQDDTLVREVTAPYRETTTLRAGTATITRDGKRPRTFSLSHAPELASLQTSFGALLAGDRAGLEQHYRLRVAGPRQRWTLTLAPKDAALAAKVREIVLYGQGAELRCIETHPAKGPLQRTLLASAARAAGDGSDAAALQTLCRDGVARP